MTVEHRVREVVDEHVAQVRQDLDARVEALTANLASLADQQRTEIEQQATEARAAGVIEATRKIRVETLQRLLGSIRRIDEADGLNGILEALSKAALDQTSRVAVLLVDGYMFRPWGHFGFEPGTEPAEMPIGASGTLASAVTVGQSSFVEPAVEGQESMEPAFMRVAGGHRGMVIPLTVGGDVVAVLYADDTTLTVGEDDTSPWPEEVELLARHAAVRLENVTSTRAVEVLARPD